MTTPTRRRFGAATIIVATLSSAAIAGGAVFLAMQRHETGARQAAQPPGAPADTSSEPKARYQCPMHPNIVQDHPGTCPICGMELVKTDEPHGERKILFYRSPMDANVTSPTPAKDAMGMDFVPVYADTTETSTESNVPGQATVDIDPARQQLIGLTTAEVTEGPVGGAWRTVGRVTVDETRVRHINVKVPGFVEHVYADFVGKAVRKGEPLFAVYSPELLSAQQDYLLALRTHDALAKGGALTADGDALVEGARRRLALWDIPESEIERVATTGEAHKTLTFYSPVSGVVTRKDIVEGMRLDAGAMPYEVTDLSVVWVLADVYENELRFIKEGMAASLTLNAFPNRQFDGTVLFIDPLLDPATRTVHVRLAFRNAKGELRPEMFGEVTLHKPPRQGLRVPRDAIIDTGTEKIVFVALGDGKFQPRIVRLGATSEDQVEVIEGLTSKEHVVTRANFLIDSESRLRAALAGLTPQGEQQSPSKQP